VTCEDCGHETISFQEWERLPESERAGKRQRCGPCCRRCYDRRRRPRKTWPLQDLIEEAEFLFLGGADQWSVAFRLGIKYDSLVRQYRRAKERGLTDRVLTYERETRERNRRIL
jgi:hypothetical protein